MLHYMSNISYLLHKVCIKSICFRYARDKNGIKRTSGVRFQGITRRTLYKFVGDMNLFVESICLYVVEKISVCRERPYRLVYHHLKLISRYTKRTHGREYIVTVESSLTSDIPVKSSCLFVGKHKNFKGRVGLGK